MKYKFKAFWGPAISLGLVIIGWWLISLTNATFSINQTVTARAYPEIYPYLGAITTIYGWIIPFVIIILFALVIINIIKGLKVNSLFKKPIEFQENLEYVISKKINRINRVYKFCITTSLIIFIPLSPLIFTIEQKPRMDINGCDEGIIIGYTANGNPIFCE